MLEEVFALPMVVRLARNKGDTQVASRVCSIIRRYAEYTWTDGVHRLLRWIAQSHADPAPGHFPLEPRAQGSRSSENLENNALNVTRGNAGYAIQALLFAHPDLMQQLVPAVEALVRDPHPAVRVASLAACLPMINVDADRAVELFLEAAKGSEAILGTRAARRFLNYTHRTHLTQLLQTIDRMTASQLQNVATMGATFVAGQPSW